MTPMRQWIFMVALGLAACGGEDTKDVTAPPQKPFTTRVVDTMADTGSDMFEAAQSPIEDVGLKRKPIPDKLQQIVAAPYAPQTPVQCGALAREIAELDALLDRDVDALATPEATGREKYIGEGADIASHQATGFVGSKVGIIPFRGIVRRVSGAEKHAKALAKAYQAGRLRRAYLKGVARAAECQKPV